MRRCGSSQELELKPSRTTISVLVIAGLDILRPATNVVARTVSAFVGEAGNA